MATNTYKPCLTHTPFSTEDIARIMACRGELRSVVNSGYQRIRSCAWKVVWRPFRIHPLSKCSWQLSKNPTPEGPALG